LDNANLLYNVTRVNLDNVNLLYRVTEKLFYNSVYFSVLDETIADPPNIFENRTGKLLCKVTLQNHRVV